jgi:hypothetical protein
MASRRKSRFKRLFARDAEAVLTDALRLRDSILEANLHLETSSAPYAALRELTDAIHKALPVIAEREPDFRVGSLGLLPLPEDYGSRK